MSSSALLLSRFTLRHWRQAPRQTLLLLLILALGIAVFVSVRLANRAAVASFRNFTDVLTRQSDLVVSAPAGDLPETALGDMRQAVSGLGVQLIPVLETTATRPRQGEDQTIATRETFQLLGLDLVAVQNLRRDAQADRSWFRQTSADNPTPGGSRLWDILANPRAVFVSKALAARDALDVGDTLTLVINDQITPLEVAGVIPELDDTPRPDRSLLVFDLPALQALADRRGRLDRVEVVLEAGPGRDKRREAARDTLATLGGESWRIESPTDREASARVMTRAFRFNLTILSLVALLVGLYLIVQALDGAVVRRREEIGILRSLGVEERSIQRAWLLEAMLLGAAGGALGLLLGWAGAQVSVRFIGQTVNALYYATSVSEARLTLGEASAALLLSVAASVAAGWMPARAAARTPPAQILVRHAAAPQGPAWWGRPWVGLLFLAAGLALAQLPPVPLAGGGRFPLAGYLAALCWIAGGGLLGGGALRRLAMCLRPLGTLRAIWKLAVSHAIQPSGRHRLAIAGLVCAVAMTSGMAILVASFETTMRGWIERTFQADLFVASDGAQSASTRNFMLPNTWRHILTLPGVAEANLLQTTEVSFPEGRTMLGGAELGFFRRHVGLAWVQQPRSPLIYQPDANAGLALVSESFALRFDKRQGDRLDVPTPSGTQSLEIAGVFADYGNERGSILVERRHFARWFGNEHVRSMMLIVEEGRDVEALRQHILAEHPGLTVYTNRHLREEILRIFRQTFSITYALELIGVAVAVAGLGMTLGSMLIERRGELTTLRALGVSRAEMAASTAIEGGLVGLSGLIAGLLTSLALGWLLIHVINRQSFGWTLQFSLPWSQMAWLSLLVLGAGTLVSFAVGRWGANLPADREE